jgi:ABC-type microcin C transport system duplicated ATPase subunit YejF
VHGVDLGLKRGQTLGVIGESGSGKSSLALGLLGLLPAKSVSGQVFHEHNQSSTPKPSAQGARKNIALTRWNAQLRRAVQVVFQDPFSSLSPRMTLQEIVGAKKGLFKRCKKWASMSCSFPTCCSALRMNSRAASASALPWREP